MPNMSHVRVAVPLVLGLALLAGPGCHTPRTTEQMRLTTLADVQQGRFAEAHAEVNALYASHDPGEPAEPEAKPESGAALSDKQALIWHMERGMIAHLAGDRGLSSRHLDAAAALVDLRRTKTLVTEAGTGVANDTLRDYAGEAYEHIQVDYYRALDQVITGQQAEHLYDPRVLVADLARRATPPPSSPTPPPPSPAVAPLQPVVSYERAINFTRRMTLNQLKETVDAAGSHRYDDDPFARVLAGALTWCPPPGERTETNRQYADVMFKTAVAAYAKEAKLLGDGKQPFIYEVRKRPALLDTLLIRHCRAYNPEWFDEHLADFGLRPGDPRLAQAELPRGHGSVLVLDHVDFITHPEVLDIRVIAASGIPVPVPTPAEHNDGVTVTPFFIGAVGFYAKGPGSDIVNHWGAVPLPGEVVHRLLAPGGAAFMGFALPVHRPDHANLPPATVRIKPEAVGGSEISRELEVVSDLDAYARATLKDEQPRLLVKTLIRATSKQVAGGLLAHEAERRNELLGLAVNLLASTAATLSEVADTRAWTTLPDHIEATLVDLPAGSYSLAIDDRYGAINLGRVTVPEGRLVVVPVRTFHSTVIVPKP
jgi:hypothetical protein